MGDIRCKELSFFRSLPCPALPIVAALFLHLSCNVDFPSQILLERAKRGEKDFRKERPLAVLDFCVPHVFSGEVSHEKNNIPRSRTIIHSISRSLSHLPIP